MTRARVVGVLALLAGLSGARSALATVTVHHASDCFPALTPTTGGVEATSNGLLYNPNTFGTSTSVLWCPIDYDNNNTAIQVGVSAVSNGCTGGSYGVAYNLCVVHTNGGTPTCSPLTVPGNGSPTCSPGTYQMVTTTFPFMVSGDYLIVNVVLQPPSGGNVNGIYGYQVVH